MSDLTIPSFDEVMRFTSGVSSHTAFEDVECEALYNICKRQLQSSVVVEIGCQLGRSSSIIGQVGKAIGYHAIHIDPYTQQFEYLSGWIRMMHSIGHPFTFLCMRTDQARRELERCEQIDLLLIDGDHTDAGVWADCLTAGELVRFGGIMCAHDYGHESLPDVYRVMSEYTKQGWTQPVVYGTLGVWQRC